MDHRLGGVVAASWGRRWASAAAEASVWPAEAAASTDLGDFDPGVVGADALLFSAIFYDFSVTVDRDDGLPQVVLVALASVWRWGWARRWRAWRRIDVGGDSGAAAVGRLRRRSA